MRAGPGHRPRRRGFTLVEMLVALALLSLVSIALFAAVHAGMRVTEAAERRTLESQALRLVSEYLRGSIESMVPLFTVQAGKRIAHFAGEPDAMRYAIEAPSRFRAGGLYEIVLEPFPTQAGRGIRMSHRLLHPDLLATGGAADAASRTLSADEGDHRILLDDATVRFGYFGAARRAAPSQWHASWEGAWGSPRLVRIEITVSGERWPDVLAQPRVNRLRFQTVRDLGPEPDEPPASSASGGADPEADDAASTPSPECEDAASCPAGSGTGS